VSSCSASSTSPRWPTSSSRGGADDGHESALALDVHVDVTVQVGHIEQALDVVSRDLALLLEIGQARATTRGGRLLAAPRLGVSVVDLVVFVEIVFVVISIVFVVFTVVDVILDVRDVLVVGAVLVGVDGCALNVGVRDVGTADGVAAGPTGLQVLRCLSYSRLARHVPLFIGLGHHVVPLPHARPSSDPHFRMLVTYAPRRGAPRRGGPQEPEIVMY